MRILLGVSWVYIMSLAFRGLVSGAIQGGAKTRLSKTQMKGLLAQPSALFPFPKSHPPEAVCTPCLPSVLKCPFWSLNPRLLFPEDSVVAARGWGLDIWAFPHPQHFLSTSVCSARVKVEEWLPRCPQCPQEHFPSPCQVLGIQNLGAQNGIAPGSGGVSWHCHRALYSHSSNKARSNPICRLYPDTRGPQGLSLVQKQCFWIPDKPHLTFKNHPFLLMA